MSLDRDPYFRLAHEHDPFGDRRLLPPMLVESVRLSRDLVLATLVCLLTVVFLVQPYRVDGSSMHPSLEDSQRIFINKAVYKIRSIERGEVVIFLSPRNPQKRFIKRIIGLPGDTVYIESGIVFVNGQRLHEPYLPDDYHPHGNMAPLTMSGGEYFVLGDNRPQSNDSRYWGAVPEDHILGKAFYRYWPPREFGGLPGEQILDLELEESP